VDLSEGILPQLVVLLLLRMEDDDALEQLHHELVNDALAPDRDRLVDLDDVGENDCAEEHRYKGESRTVDMKGGSAENSWAALAIQILYSNTRVVLNASEDSSPPFHSDSLVPGVEYSPHFLRLLRLASCHQLHQNKFLELPVALAMAIVPCLVFPSLEQIWVVLWHP